MQWTEGRSGCRLWWERRGTFQDPMTFIYPLLSLREGPGGHKEMQTQSGRMEGWGWGASAEVSLWRRWAAREGYVKKERLSTDLVGWCWFSSSSLRYNWQHCISIMIWLMNIMKWSPQYVECTSIILLGWHYCRENHGSKKKEAEKHGCCWEMTGCQEVRPSGRWMPWGGVSLTSVNLHPGLNIGDHCDGVTGTLSGKHLAQHLPCML